MTTYPKMDPEIKEDWVEALRSGEFVQTQNYLDKDDAQCCLGVLCDILDVDWEILDDGCRLYDGESAGWLSDYVRHVAGISGGAEAALSDLNDVHEATFPEIADWIEAHL